MVSHNHQHDRRRDQNTQRARGRDHTSGQTRAVFLLHHRGQGQDAQEDDRCTDDTSGGRKDNADQRHSDRKTTAHGAEQTLHRAHEFFSHAAFVQHQAHEDEHRQRHKDRVRHRGIDTVHSRAQGQIVEAGKRPLEPCPRHEIVVEQVSDTAIHHADTRQRPRNGEAREQQHDEGQEHRDNELFLGVFDKERQRDSDRDKDNEGDEDGAEAAAFAFVCVVHPKRVNVVDQTRDRSERQKAEADRDDRFECPTIRQTQGARGPFVNAEALVEIVVALVDHQIDEREQKAQDADDFDHALTTAGHLHVQHVHTHVAIGHEGKGNADHRHQPVEMPLDFIELWEVLVQSIAKGHLRHDREDQQHVGPHHDQTDAFHNAV